MKFNITATIVHHHYNHSDDETKSLLKTIIKNQNKMALTQEQLAAELKVIKEQNDKARAEVLAKIAALEAAIADAGNTTEAVDIALAELKASVQTDDDIVADAPEGGE